MVLDPYGLLGDNGEKGDRFSQSEFIFLFGLLVEEEEEERLADVNVGVSFFERSMSSGSDVLDAVISTRPKSGVVGGVLVVKSMISSDRRRGGCVSSSRTNALGVGCIVEWLTKDAAAVLKCCRQVYSSNDNALSSFVVLLVCVCWERRIT